MNAGSRPQRTCICCRVVRPQRELVRLAAVDGRVVVSRVAPGRGAWLCPEPRCVAGLTRGAVIARALRQPGVVVDADELAADVVLMGADVAETRASGVISGATGVPDTPPTRQNGTLHVQDAGRSASAGRRTDLRRD